MYQEFAWDTAAIAEPAEPLRKSSLSQSRAYLLEMMQVLRFGWIRNLRIQDGEPDLTSDVAMIQNVKLNGRNEPHPLLSADDYVLKREVVLFFIQLDAIGDGLIESIEVKDGLPFLLHVLREPLWPPTVPLPDRKHFYAKSQKRP